MWAGAGVAAVEAEAEAALALMVLDAELGGLALACHLPGLMRVGLLTWLRLLSLAGCALWGYLLWGLPLLLGLCLGRRRTAGRRAVFQLGASSGRIQLEFTGLQWPGVT